MKLWFIDRGNELKQIHYRVKDTVYETKSRFQQITILDTYDLGRILVLGKQIQSSESDEYIYHEGLVHPAMVAHNCPKEILILGGGEGATLREVLKHSTVDSVIMVDIDQTLIETSKKYLSNWHSGSFEDPRTELIIKDAFEFVNKTNKAFDVIICDIDDPVEGSPAATIYTKEFYESIKGILKEDGIFVTQTIELLYNENDLHSILNKTIASVFKITESYCEYIPSFDGMWGFVIGSNKVSAKNLARKEIQRRLSERKVDDLKFYDDETHNRMFCLPKVVREYIEKQTRISTINKPLHVFPG
jgi:spermidine synthase